MQYTVGLFVQHDADFICSLECTHDTPLDALKCMMDLVEDYALSHLFVRRDYNVRFVVCVGSTVDVQWYYYNATIRVSYKIPKGEDDDERVVVTLIPQVHYIDNDALHTYEVKYA